MLPVYPRVCGGTTLLRLRTPSGNGLSPRVRGTVGLADDGNLDVGLSPRVRGNPLASPNGVLYLGSIPACAGEPEDKHRLRAQCRVYPRVCGGTAPQDTHSSVSTGLSPRVRGNPNVLEYYVHLHRSIPACAGEPVPCYPPKRYSEVYPRVCGGTSLCGCHTVGSRGLSPRVRGNR